MKTKLIYLILLIFVSLSSCKKDEIITDPDPNLEEVHYENTTGAGEIGKAGGTITVVNSGSELNGAGIEIPAGALNQITDISISLNKSVKAPTDTNAVVVKFEPNGLTFDKEVTIKLPFSGNPENATVYYYNSDSVYVENLEIVNYDNTDKVITAKTSHFSEFYAGEDGVFADVELYKVNNKVKCQVRFYSKHGSYEGLAWINLLKSTNLIQLWSYVNALNLLENFESLIGNKVYAIIKVKLKQEQFIGSKEIASKTLVVKRDGSAGNFHVELSELQEDNSFNTLYTSGTLDRGGLDLFFSGKALIFDLNAQLEDGKKYFVETSWVLSSSAYALWNFMDAFTEQYKINTKKQDKDDKKVWTLSDMINSDPDTDNNGINDIYSPSVTKPGVSTSAVTIVSFTTASSGGTVTADGGATVTARGLCWSTSPAPTISDSHTNNGSGLGSFSGNLTGLTENTAYYMRAYATNSAGTSYGETRTFTTKKANSLPSVTTGSISNITQTTATSGGNISDDGGTSVTARGVCWSTSQNPSTANAHTTDGNGTGSFTSSLTGLIAGTTYYVRAYAANSEGTAYGDEEIFTTTGASGLPSLTTSSISSITQTSAISGGNISDDGGASVTARGVCWSTSQNPTIDDAHNNNGSGTGTFVSSLTELMAGTTYYVRAYATNNVGTAYGNEQTFTTSTSSGNLIAYYPFNGNTNDESGNNYNATVNGPVLTADRFSNSNSAYLFDGDKDYIQMDTKLPISGFPLSISVWINPYSFSSDGINYIYASDDWDHYWGSYKGFSLELRSDGHITARYAAGVNTSVRTFNTDANIIKLNNWIHIVAVFSTPDDVKIYINKISKTLSDVSPDNKTVSFSSTKDRIGFAYDGIDRHSFDGALDDIKIYDYALSETEIQSLYSEGGWQGSETGTLTDYDNNTYNTVKIGNQWWMAENLKVTHYSDGTAIPLVTDNTAWGNLGANNTDKAYCYYNNNANNEADTYGALYTWAAAMNGASSSTANPSGIQGVCPTGWHLPSDAEWNELVTYLGGESLAGGKMKEIGTIHWNSPNTGATNESGFSALPGGYRRNDDGSFGNVGYADSWWSSTEYYSSDAYDCDLDYYHSDVYCGNFNKSLGFSVRCLKDN